MGFIVFIHIVACILLVITILMQAGRGGGLAESFASAESMFGTQTNAFMVRFSTVLAVIFFSTSLILAVNSAKGQKSLMAHAKLSAQAAQAAKAAQAEKLPEPTVKVGEPMPVVKVKTTAGETVTKAVAATTDAANKVVEPITNMAK